MSFSPLFIGFGDFFSPVILLRGVAYEDPRLATYRHKRLPLKQSAMRANVRG